MPDFSGDTSMGVGGAAFRSTVWDCLKSIQGPESPESRSAINRLVEWYWKPVYRCIRIGWNKSNEEAKDLTQSFFLTMLERDALLKADPARGKFRTFLKTALRNFLTNEHRDAHAVKRGGGVSVLPQDFQADPPDVAAPTAQSPEGILDQEWARTLFGAALERLKQSLTGEEAIRFRIFEACDLGGPGAPEPTHEELGRRFDRSPGEIKRTLKDVRDRLRGFVVDEIGKYAQSKDEVGEELAFIMTSWS